MLLLALLLSATPEVRLLTLGDSFTIGTGAPPEAAWPRRLADAWSRACPVRLENPARNGFTTDDLLARELSTLPTFQPTLVTLSIGANDLVRGRSVEAYEARVHTIFDRLAAAGVPADRVITLPQPDWSASPTASAFGAPAALHARIDTFNAALARVSAARGARHIAVAARLDRPVDVAPDGLHPSAASHMALADALVAAIPVPCG